MLNCAHGGTHMVCQYFNGNGLTESAEIIGQRVTFLSSSNGFTIDLIFEESFDVHYAISFEVSY